MAKCKTGLDVQSWLFDARKWNRTKARLWLKRHGQKTPKADETDNYVRYRQKIPAHFKKGSFRTIAVDERKGIKAVVACPRSGRSNPMPTILALNPKPKRKKPAKKRSTKKQSQAKGKQPMAKKKKRGGKKKRRNPSGGGFARSTIGGVHFMNAVKDSIPMLFGAVAAKFAAKRFADGGGEMEDWTWKNYLLAVAGGLVGAIAVSAVIKGRGNIAQKVFQGALVLIVYKIWTLEIAPKNATLESWFGEYPEGNEYGQIWQGDETDYMTGGDGFWRPVDETHRLPSAAGFGQVVPYAPGAMGDDIVAPGPVMGQDVAMAPASSDISQEFVRAYG